MSIVIGVLLIGILVFASGIMRNINAKTMSEKEIDELNSSDVNMQTSYYYLPVGTYDSADTAILQKIDKDSGKVTLYNTTAAKTYTLNYDGTTYVSDKYGTSMSMDQLNEGTIVNVNFFKATKQLVDIQISPEAWTYDNITRYNLGGLNSTAVLGDRTYALTKGVQVFSQGEQTDLMNIVNGDSISVTGIGYDIYSIRVESGHGYIRLNNDESLLGGWIEIGNELITKVTEPNMLLAVPEGNYSVRMYNDNSEDVQEIIVDRNQEIILDCSSITAPVDVYGSIIFHLTPESAHLSLDGELQNASNIVKTEYGIHQIEVSADGYDTLTRYINVGNEISEISIRLDESVAYVEDANDSETNSVPTTSGNSAVSGNNTKTTSGNAISGNSVSNNKSTSASVVNRVYIYSPTDVEVYVDGIYMGLSPMNFKKVTGSHTIILKKSGYETRSYTIYCYDDGKDMSISFSELEKIADSKDSSSHSNSNTDDGNITSEDTNTNTDTSPAPTTNTSTNTNTNANQDVNTNTDSNSNTNSNTGSSSNHGEPEDGTTDNDSTTETVTDSEQEEQVDSGVETPTDGVNTNITTPDDSEI